MPTKKLQIPPGLLNPEAIKKTLCEKSFHFFVNDGWRVLEPQTEYVDGKHIKVICETLEKCKTRDIQELIINVPPGHTKSMLCTVFFPAWVWLTEPGARFICASHSLRQATKHSVLCRQLIESHWYQSRWADRFKLADDQNQKTSYLNDQGGHRNIASPGIGTGDSAEYLIVDDAHEIMDTSAESLVKVAEWYDTTLSSRIRDPQKGVKIVIGQRVSQDDITGHLLKRGGYTHICLPALYEPNHPYISDYDWRSEPDEPLWPERYTKDHIDKVKATTSTQSFETLQQQRPSPPGGNIVKEDWLKYYQPHELPDRFDMIIQSWDANFGGGKHSDYVVGTVWGKKGALYYLLDLVRGRWDFADTLREIRTLTARHPLAGIKLVENKANGPAIISSLKSEISGINAFNPGSSNKEARLQSVLHVIEAGQMLLPISAPWLDDYRAELTNFPSSSNDDQVDSTTQALIYLSKNRTITSTGGIY